MDQAAPQTRSSIKDLANELRRRISEDEGELKAFRAPIGRADFAPSPLALPDLSEMLANCTLALRHLEDARMRLGKVIQAWEGGISCFDPKHPMRQAVHRKAEPEPGEAIHGQR